jgi:4-amino-4-deoxy-L-arabinose transferase-like glycosyltransferase
MSLSVTNDSSFTRKIISNSILALFFLLICRLISMYFIPLNDSTEARYGEISRIMLETGNWITPMHQYGVPFWAKPPLSSWLSAFSMYIFGVNEFALRLPALILSLGILYLIWGIAKTRESIDVAKTSVLVLASSIFFFLDAGTVMTDPALLFCTTLTMVSFWRAVVDKNKLYGFLFFVALGLGLLSKGPIALVLTGMPIFIWVLIHKRWCELWNNLPWVKGTILMLIIAMPWYLLAEYKTPGFLNYFIIGEHFKRFLQPGWGGDMYGFAHTAPYGTIWLYILLGIFPWSIPAAFWILKHKKNIPSFCNDDDHWVSYLLICTLTPLVFFTFARNIIYPYVFPSLPTFALLFAILASRSKISFKSQQRIVSLSLVTGVFFLFATVLFIYQPVLVEKSQRRVVKVFKESKPANDSMLVYWANKTDYSAQFYSAGKSRAVSNTVELCEILSNKTKNLVVVESNRLEQFPLKILIQLNRLDEVSVLKKKYIILLSNGVTC